MIKKLEEFLKKNAPSEERIRAFSLVQYIEHVSKRKLEFKATRRNIPGAFAIGLFCAFFPIPGQMAVASLIAIYFRKNILAAALLVWITNPLTIPPIAFFNYRLGAFLLRLDSIQIKFEPTTQWLIDFLHTIWWPLLFGTVIIATLTSTAGYFGMKWLLQLAVVISNRKRLAGHKNKNPSFSSNDPQSPD